MADATYTHAVCDRQDITRAKITQDIGVVVVVDTAGILLAISSDHARRGWVKRDVSLEDVGKVHITQVFHEDVARVIEEGVEFCAHEKPPNARTYICDIFFAHRTYVSMLAQSDGRLVVEIEDFNRQLLAVNTIVDTANVIGKLTANTGQVDTVNNLCRELFKHSSYDRVMTYKFLDDLSGEVVYELKDDDVVHSSFLGMRFPPGDIPLPARKAYVDNPVRFIADVSKPSCHMIQKSDDISLARSFLRGCVAPHRSYLRAMEVRSSLSIAITNMDGELWGLIAMHSYTQPIVPTIEDRVSHAILASVASGHVQHLEKVERLAIETRIKSLVSQIDTRESLGVFIVQNEKLLLETFNIDSVSLFAPDAPPTTVGEGGVTLEDLPAESGDPLTCGELTKPLRSFACLSVLGYKIVFTRTCTYNPIAWAGNPSELNVSTISSDMVMPRQSFEQYLDHKSQNPPPFTKQDRLVFARTGDLLKSIIHQMKIEYFERKIAQARQQSHVVEQKSDEDYAFFATMSHELRTPLHAINGVFEIIQDMDRGDNSIRRYTAIGLETCKDMMRTLNDILTIVKKTHEHKQIDISLVMVKEVFSSTSNGLRMFASKNGVRLDVAFECCADKLVRVDVHKTIQIYNNIGGNAIKFSTDPGRNSKTDVEVRVHLVDSEDSVKELWSQICRQYAGSHIATKEWDREISVTLCRWLVFQTRDHGCGIHQDDMPQMFKKFAQIGSVIKKKFASTGLGLHIGLLNVEAMNGILSVASTPDEGSVFFCAIPVEDASGETKKASSFSSASSEDDSVGPEFSDRHVVFVVVDDSKVNVMIAKKQIEREFVHAEVHTAANGKLGVQLVESLENQGVHMDGIFMDYHMPVTSGIEATQQIRKTNKSVPIAMLTADITETSRSSMLASGADLILLKPSKPGQIAETCTSMIMLALDKKLSQA